jgi:predicted amidohydrolase YtcJ
MGIPVAGSSDFPVSAAHPMTRIQSLVTRTSAEGRVYGPEQRLLPEQAIQVFTMGGAYASFEEESKGSIEEGKLADLVVLSADPTEVPPLRLREIRVEMTLIGGEIVFEREGSTKVGGAEGRR